MRRLFATRSRETSVLHYRAQRCVHQPQTRGGREAGNATADLISPRSTASFIATSRVVSDTFLNRASVAADCSQRNVGKCKREQIRGASRRRIIETTTTRRSRSRRDSMNSISPSIEKKRKGRRVPRLHSFTFGNDERVEHIREFILHAAKTDDTARGWHAANS